MAAKQKEYNVPQEYSQLFDKLFQSITDKTAAVEYTPRSDSALKSALSKALRPGYDQAIQTRKSQAAANRAAIDADAASRGMGSSTWVTDVKNRQNNAMASDIANLEGNYQSALYNSLLSKMSEQDNLAMTAKQINAGNWNNALAQALAGTDQWWKTWKGMGSTASSGGSGGSGGSSGSGSRTDTFQEWLKKQQQGA